MRVKEKHAETYERRKERDRIFGEIEGWLNERKATFNKTGQRGHCIVKEETKKDREVKKDKMSATGDMKRGGQQGLGYLRKCAVMEGETE